MKRKQNISMIRGDSHVLRVTVMDERDPTVPFVFLPGDVVVAAFKSDVNAERELISKSFEITPEFEGNVIEFEISNDDTKDLNFGNYVYDIKVIRGDLRGTIVPTSSSKIGTEVVNE